MATYTLEMVKKDILQLEAKTEKDLEIRIENLEQQVKNLTQSFKDLENTVRQIDKMVMGINDDLERHEIAIASLSPILNQRNRQASPS